MRKTLAIILALGMLLSLAGCTEKKEEQEESGTFSSQEQGESSVKEDPVLDPMTVAQNIMEFSDAPQEAKEIVLKIFKVLNAEEIRIEAEGYTIEGGDIGYKYFISGNDMVHGLKPFDLFVVLASDQKVESIMLSDFEALTPEFVMWEIAGIMDLQSGFDLSDAMDKTLKKEFYFAVYNGWAMTIDYNDEDETWTEVITQAEELVQYGSMEEESSTAATDSSTTSSQNRYGSGMYKVGSEVAPGTYYIKATSSYGAYWAISSDSTGSFDSLLANANVDTFGYLTVEEGQYLEITRGEIIPAEEAPIPQPDADGCYGEGQYLVGRDIPAGEYNATSISKYGGYYGATSDANGRDIIANDNFDTNTYLTVSDGQYLEVTRAKIKPTA